MENKVSHKLIIQYTLIFVLCSLFIFSPFYLNGKSLVYNKDGWMQYLKLLIYYSEYIREILRNIFINHSFVIPQWNFSIGEGADIFTTFQCYAFGDPIAFLSVFFNGNNMYVFYIGSIILRLYLAGVAFIWLCYYERHTNKYAILSGALAYVFCMWNFFNSIRHLHFLTPMIYFPIFIISLEELINKEKPLMFSIMVFLTGIINFYFFCIIVMITVVYVAIRLLTLYGKDYKKVIRKLFEIFVYSVIGAIMAGIVIIPMLHAFTDDFRLEITTNVRLLYPINFYKSLPGIVFSTNREYWLCLGFASQFVLSVISILYRRKEKKFLFAMNIFVLFCVVCPVFGQITNGMKYITNKWSFAVALLISYEIVSEWDFFVHYKKQAFAIYALLIAGLMALRFSISVLIPVSLGLVTIGLLFLKNPIYVAKKDIRQLLIFATICLCVCFNGFWFYSPVGANLIVDATDISDNKEIMNLSEAKAISEIMDSAGRDFYRYSGNDLTKNASLIFDTYSTDYYWSLSNKYVSRYRVDMEIDEYSLSGYREYGKRPVLYSLANVKYYVSSKPEEVPSGYSFYKNVDGYDIYSNNNFLPFGYTYDNAISYKEWDKLNVAQKEKALTKYAVIDELENDSRNSVDCLEMDYKVIGNEDVVINDDKINVSSKQAYIDLLFDEITGKEVYVSINGLSYTDTKSWLRDPNTETFVEIEGSNGFISSIRYATADDKNQHGRHDFTVYLGSPDSLNSIRLYFTEKGEYVIEDISIYVLDSDWYENDLKKLKEDVLQNVEIRDNHISGNIDLKRNKYLVLTIPYSNDWVAYVDGEKTETLIANGCYTGLYLDAGKHQIELKYSPKLLNVGVFVSVIGLALFVGAVVYGKKEKTNTKK